MGIYFLKIPPNQQDHTRLETDHKQSIVVTVPEEEIAIAALSPSHFHGLDVNLCFYIGVWRDGLSVAQPCAYSHGAFECNACNE